MSLARALDKILIPLNKLIRILMIFSFSAMVALIFTQIIYRYVLTRPIPWAEEAARYFFVWATFLGASVAVRTKAHTGVDFFLNRVPEKVRKMMVLLSYIASIIFLGFISRYGLSISLRVMRQTSPALQLPMTYAYIAIPIGAFLMLLNFVYLLAKEIENQRSETPDLLDVVGGVEEGLQKEDLKDDKR
ncbi:MAG: TRAP transporter small permease [Bacillota bacterium]|nr:TRAP transporter small permease [Bacillota bacterium]MDW7671035.1 TRAP transporter small permease [Bacillota bacterium]